MKEYKYILFDLDGTITDPKVGITNVSGSELDGTRARKSEVIMHALQQNKIVDLSSVIMIGDREHDIIGAKEAGILSIGVLFGYGNRKEHEQAGADYIVETVDGLISFFAK